VGVKKKDWVTKNRRKKELQKNQQTLIGVAWHPYRGETFRGRGSRKRVRKFVNEKVVLRSFGKGEAGTKNPKPLVRGVFKETSRKRNIFAGSREFDESHPQWSKYTLCERR